MSETKMESGPVSAGPTAATVRQWARGAGVPVNDKGKVPASVYEAYAAAHATEHSADQTAATASAPTVPPPPGWYPDPSGSSSQRWWDGSTWTDHRRDSRQEVAAAIPAQRQNSYAPVRLDRNTEASRRGSAAVVVAGAVLAIIGALLPWISVDTPFGSLSRSGASWDSSDATIIIVLAALAGLTGIGQLARWKVPGWLLWVGVLIGIIDFAIAAYAGHEVHQRNDAAQQFSSAVTAHVGAGVYLCGAAAVIILVGSFASARSRS